MALLDIINQIRTLLIANTALGLTEKTCTIDLDKTILSMIEENKDRGCILMFGGGVREPRETFSRAAGGQLVSKGMLWKWNVNGIYMLHFTGDAFQIELDVLLIIDQLSELLVDNQRLGGLVPFADMSQIGMPDGADIQDMAYYFIPFSIEVWDKR